MFRILMAPWRSWTVKGSTVLITAPAPSPLRPTLHHIASYQHGKHCLSMCVFRRNTSCWPHRNVIQKGLSEPVQAHAEVKYRIKVLFTLILDKLCPGIFAWSVSPYLGLITPSHLVFLSQDSENLTGSVHMAPSQSSWLHSICTKHNYW